MSIATIAVASLVAALVVVGPLLGIGENPDSLLGASGFLNALWVWVRWPVVFALIVAWAATIYHLIPRRQNPWRQELPGAALATCWWLAVSTGFRFYIDLASNGVNAIFGFLGGALSLLLWLYLLSMGLLAGALLNAINTARHRAPEPVT